MVEIEDLEEKDGVGVKEQMSGVVYVEFCIDG